MKKYIGIVTLFVISVVVISCGKTRKGTCEELMEKQAADANAKYEKLLEDFDRSSVYENLHYPAEYLSQRKFLEDNSKKETVKTTESGLQYEVVKMGNGAQPTATSRVKVHYRGTLIDGSQFDSSYDRGEPITFGLNQVIRGWTEGVQLMPVGSIFKFYIPYDIAYGPNGNDRGMIGPYATLIFDVELLGIE